MKKLLAVLLCLVMVVSLFAACNQNTPATTTKPAATNPPATSGNQPAGTTAPQTTAKEEPAKIVIAMPLKANVADYDDNALTHWLEETCNVEIEYMLLQTAAADYKSQIATMLLDNNAQWPDIMMHVSLGRTLYEQYGQDGYLLDLKPYFDDKEKSANFWERYEIFDEASKELIMQLIADQYGAYYAVPSMEKSEVDLMYAQAMINKDWLTKLNLPMPTDIDSLYNTLVAFRDQDPNGNGIKDEIPLLGRRKDNYGDPVGWIINMYIYCNKQYYWSVDENGKLFLPNMQDEYREALKFCNKLVKEGLMPESVFSMTNTDTRKIINYAEGDVQTAGVILGHPTVQFNAVDHPAVNSYTALPYWGNTFMRNAAPSGKTFIMSTAENPDACFKVIMQLYTEEGAARVRYGDKGVDWDWADPGATSFLGFPAIIKYLGPDIWGTTGNSCWYVAGPTFNLNPEGEYVQFDEASMDAWSVARKKLTREVKDAHTAGVEKTKDVGIGPVLLTQEETDLSADIMTNITGFLDNATATFICGTDIYNDPSDDAQWAAYLDEISKMGYSTYQKIYQNAYDRKLAG